MFKYYEWMMFTSLLNISITNSIILHQNPKLICSMFRICLNRANLETRTPVPDNHIYIYLLLNINQSELLSPSLNDQRH